MGGEGSHGVAMAPGVGLRQRAALSTHRLRYIEAMTRNRVMTRNLYWRTAFVATLAVATTIVGSGGCGSKDDDGKRIRALEFLGQAPSFSLIDQTATRFTTADLLGKVTIINFIFTRCPTVCPIFTRRFQRIIHSLDNVKPIQFVSISVDPEHDTSTVLADYANEHNADPARWKFLTGDPEAIRLTAEKGLKLVLERSGTLADGTPDIVHATHFVLIDKQGNIRGYYDSGEKARREALILDAKALARINPPGS